MMSVVQWKLNPLVDLSTLLPLLMTSLAPAKSIFKSEVFDKFKEYEAFKTNNTGDKLVALRSDNGW